MQTTYGNIVFDPGLFFRLTTVITLVGGTIFLMWLGEQISSRGVGNGISLIITAGIIANLPSAFVSTLQLGRTGELSIAFILGILTGAKTTIKNFETVNTSSPSFLKIMKILGVKSEKKI